jgi:thioesterase domain-containing protein
MAWCWELFGDWKPPMVSSPTLLVRASEPMTEEKRDTDWQATWDSVSATADVPGNHFTMMEEHVGSTAAAVREWFGEIM